MATPPPPLKSIIRFLKAAKQIEKYEPVIAYYCKYYAVQLGAELRPNPGDNTCNAYLLQLMDQLEKDKTALGDKLDVDGAEVVKAFAYKVFKVADDQDRAGKAGKTTARDFLHASIFMEVYSQFGELPKEIVDLKKYAKWKAVQITTALNNGEIPTPGPVGFQDGMDEFDDMESFPPSTSQPSFPGSTPQPFPNSTPQPSFPASTPQPSFSNSTPQQPSIPSQRPAGNSQAPFQPPNFQQPSQQPPQPNFQQPPQPNFQQSQSNFQQPSQQPPQPNFQQPPQPNFQQPPQPNFQQSQPNFQQSQPNFQQPPQQPYQQNQNPSPNFQNQQKNNTQPNVSESQNRPPMTQNNPPPMTQNNPPQRDNTFKPYNAQSQSTSTTHSYHHHANDEQLLEAQNMTKQALSALQFEDVTTAVKKLKHALFLLDGNNS